MKTCFTVALSTLAGIAVGVGAVQGLHAQSKPPAYVIAEIDVTDQDGYAKEYLSRSAKPINEEGGGKFAATGCRPQRARGPRYPDPPRQP